MKKMFVSITPWIVFSGMAALMLWLMLSLSRVQELMICLMLLVVVLIPFVYYRNQAQRTKGKFFVSLTDILLVIMVGGGLLMTGFTVEGGQLAQVLGHTDRKLALILVEILAMTCVNAYDSDIKRKLQ